MIWYDFDSHYDTGQVGLDLELQLLDDPAVLQLLLGEEWHPWHESLKKINKKNSEVVWVLPWGLSILSVSGQSVSPLSITACVNIFLILPQLYMCLKRCVTLTATHSLTDLDRHSVLQTLNPHFEVCAVSGFYKKMFQPIIVLQCFMPLKSRHTLDVKPIRDAGMF